MSILFYFTLISLHTEWTELKTRQRYPSPDKRLLFFFFFFGSLRGFFWY